jgi:hypothetical protein
VVSRVSVSLIMWTGGAGAQSVADCSNSAPALQWGMTALTRRRSPDALQETWQVHYGDVRVGTIAMRSGTPADTDPWGWSCGGPAPCPAAPAEDHAR